MVDGEEVRDLLFFLLPHFKLWMRICVFDFVLDWPEETPCFLVYSITVVGIWRTLEDYYRSRPVEVELLLLRLETFGREE